MRLSVQLFQQAFKPPRDLAHLSTSELIEAGAFCRYVEAGIPFYLPLGKRVVDRLGALALEEAEDLGFAPVEIPMLVSDESLASGQELVDTFTAKLLPVGGRLEGYHVLSTPETTVLDLADRGLESYRQLPIRYIYLTEMCRGLRRASGILKAHQFKVFGGMSLDRDDRSYQDAMRRFETLTDRLLERAGVPTHKRPGRGPVSFRHYYLCEEGDNLDLPEIDERRRVRALELSMGYAYEPANRLTPRFRTPANRNGRAKVASYGLGFTRLLYAVFDSSRDDLGFRLPAALRPLDVTVVPSRDELVEPAVEIGRRLAKAGLRVAVDDRARMSTGARAAVSDLVGAAAKVILRKDRVELLSRDRQCSEVVRSPRLPSEIVTRIDRLGLLDGDGQGGGPPDRLPYNLPIPGIGWTGELGP